MSALCIRTGLLLFLMVIMYSVHGQQICGDDERPGSTCSQTCMLCDIDGISKYIEDDNFVSFGKQGCNTAAGDTYAFVAMSTSLTVEVSIADCLSENGSPVAASFVIYEDGGTCSDSTYGWQLEPLTECAGQYGENSPQYIKHNSSKIFKTTRGLVIGNVYFFDVGTGDGGVKCRYSIKVLEGSTAVPQLTSFELDNSYTPCQGETVDYTVTNPEPITRYVYTLDGDTVSTDASAQVTYDRPGTYQLCITGSNPCSQAIPTCYTITVNPPTTTDTTLYLCPGECFDTPDATLCTPGTYPLTLTDRNGCDSIVNLTLIEQQPDVTELAATICNGDTLRYLDQNYFAAGTYPSVLTNRYGCDSTVNLELVLAACPLAGQVTASNVRCHDGTDGSIRFSLSSGSPPYRYDFRRLGGGPSGNGTVALREEETTLSGLPAGTYLIEVADDFGSVGYLNTVIERPAPVAVDVEAATYTGSDLSCTGGADGRITAVAAGGTGAFTFQWSHEPSLEAATATNLTAGTYTIFATDANGCTASTSVRLRDPPPLRLEATVSPERCDSLGTGQLVEATAEGGTGTALLTLLRDNGDTIRQQDYSALTAGNYRLLATDANGCMVDTAITVTAPARPTLDLRAAAQRIELGETVELSTQGQVGTVYAWQPDSLVDCADCSQVTSRPGQTTQYILTATSLDGCTASDSLTVEVITTRRVYLPTAFSPNGDGSNDVLRLYPGHSVQLLRNLRIYDRWGGLSYQLLDVDATRLATVGWDGAIDGEAAPPGVYVWQAEVLFIDGTVELFQGSTVLLK